GYPEIRTEGIATSKDKVSRAYLRSGLFENGKVHVRKDQHLFIDELVLFPDAAHDDQFDAFDFAMTVADLVGAPPPKPDLPKGPKLPGFGSSSIPKF
ncbi:MAG: hypothetical protein SVM80_12360, partial [Halobacteriota archaeon]|nr:hypothetical protein [Halobacteriota archaeon]